MYVSRNFIFLIYIGASKPSTWTLSITFPIFWDINIKVHFLFPSWKNSLLEQWWIFFVLVDTILVDIGRVGRKKISAEEDDRDDQRPGASLLWRKAEIWGCSAWKKKALGRPYRTFQCLNRAYKKDGGALYKDMWQ